MNAGAVASAVVMMNSAREEEEDCERRNSRRGKDQLYVEIRRPIEWVGEKIASMFDNWLYDPVDKDVKKEGSKFSWGAFFMTAFFGSMFGMMALMFWQFECDWYSSCPFFAPIPTTIISCIILFFAIVMGVSGGGAKSISYIDLKEQGKTTDVLIKIYDDDGYRNLDERELNKMLRKLGVRE